MAKKMMVLAMTVVAVLGIPSLAAANIKDKGTELKTGENPHILAEGSVAFTSASGSLNCASGATLTVELTGGTNQAVPTSFTVDEPSKCTVGGLIGSTCGKNSFGFPKFTLANEWTFDPVLKIWFWDFLKLDLNFGTCATIELEGELKVTPNSSSEIKEVVLSGEMSSSFGKFSVSGKLAVTPSGTYGY